MGNKHTTQPISFQNESPSDDFGRSTINNNNHSHHHRNKPVMDRLRKSFRGSFRKKKDHHITESSKPHQWQADEQAVRNGTCSFPVKYLGCVEVYESRGMHVCEEALKLLRNSRRRPIKGNLFVTGDGLRVVDEETKGLLVDQTIEKVSFCAPDRNHEKGFSYICRDGTTRRWMCHGFHALKDSGDRLSHAVGCAFAVCLERKQKRDKELVSMNFDSKTSTFTRTGSFRQVSLTERLTDIQSVKPSEPPPIKPVHNPYAIERPHATPQLLQRQGSFRGLGGLSQSSPFKRQLSLRLNDLPSNLERTRSHSLESAGDLFPPAPRSNGASTVTPIPEASPSSENKADTISAMCKELSQGLSLLSNNEDPLNSPSKSLFQSPKSFNSNGSPMATPSPVLTNDPFSAPPALPTSSPAFSFNRTSSSSPFDLPPGDEKITLTSNIPLYAPATSNLKSSSTTRNGTNTPNNNSIPQASTTLTQQQQLKNIITTSVSTLASSSTPTKGQLNMSLHNRSITSQFTSPSRSYSSDSSPFPFHRNKLSSLGSARTTEAGLSSQHSSQLFQTTNHSSFDNNSSGVLNSSTVLDPFDADWVAFESRHQSDDSNNIHRSTNPFIPNTAGRVKAFQVQM